MYRKLCERRPIGRFECAVRPWRNSLVSAVRSRRGATALEFALVAVPMVLLMLGLIETALQLTGATPLDHGTLRASRFGSTGASTMPGAPPCRMAAIPWVVTQASGGFLRPQNLTVAASAHDNYADAEAGLPGTSGAGSGGQIVTYTLTYRQPFMTGAFVALVTGQDHLEHRSTIIVKNEPFIDVAC